jgi:hypothetical protein
MRELSRKLFSSLPTCLLTPLVVYAQARPSFTTQPNASSTGSAVGEVAGTWWVWLGVVAIIGMLGFLIYLRKQPAE